jgi:hypothetical protein
MAELGWNKYILPSRGVLYGGRLPDGEVQIRPLQAREQAKLMQQGGGIMGKVDALISTCIKLPDKITPKELLLVDRFAVLLALRTKTFGPEYTFDYRCEGCTEQQKGHINIIEDLSERTPEGELQEPVEVELPDLGQTVKMRFLRGEDEEQVAKNARRVKMQSNDADDQSYLIRLAMQVVEIEDELPEKIAPLPFRQRWIENLTASDLCVLEDTMNDLEPGIDTRIYPECGKCAYVNTMTMPFSAEFFRPRRRSRSRNA